MYFTEFVKYSDSLRERRLKGKIDKKKAITLIRSENDPSKLDDILRECGIPTIVLLDDADPESAREIAEALAIVSGDFPRIVTRLDWVTTSDTLFKLLENPRSFGDFYRFTNALSGIVTIDELRECILTSIKEAFVEKDNVYAQHSRHWPFYDFVVFNSKRFGKGNRQTLLRLKKSDEEGGWAPSHASFRPGRAIALHEFAHVVDLLLGVSKGKELEDYLKGRDEEDISELLGEYASTERAELVAEAYAEARGSFAPRGFALDVATLLRQAYRRAFPNG